MDVIKNECQGYVYILEVKDIYLPVCKIGMTTRTPSERCNEINKSSTGDFIWEVAHSVAVDDCRKLESLAHKKLSPLRQKGREFFNLKPEDAILALDSIIEGQADIKTLPHEDNSPKIALKKTSSRKHASQHCEPMYIDVLQSFTSILNIKGRPFGQLNKPLFGMSDGAEGTQWNLSISKETGDIRLGINLEGLKYKDWPISRLILSEMDKPTINTLDIQSPENVFIRFSRDAWQASSRSAIKESLIGGKEISLSACNTETWLSILTEAATCLNEEKNFHGRKKQSVTLISKQQNGEQARIMEVSPHLTIWTPINTDGDIQEDLRKKLLILDPIYHWVKELSQA